MLGIIVSIGYIYIRDFSQVRNAKTYCKDGILMREYETYYGKVEEPIFQRDRVSKIIVRCVK